MKAFIKSTPFLAIVTCFLWASSFVPTKVGLDFFPAPLHYAGYTFIISGLILIPWANHKRNFIQQLKKHFPIALKIGFFSTTLLYGSYYTGQNYVDASIVSLIVGCQPLFVAIMAHFILKNEKFNKVKVFSIILAIIGLVVVSYPSFSEVKSIGWMSAIGIMLIIVDCLSASYGNIIVSQVDFARVDIRVINAAQLFLGGFMLMILAVIIEGPQQLPSFSNDGYLFYICLAAMVFITVFSAIIWFSLLARPNTKVSNLNMWKFLIPVIGSLQSWTLLRNDKPTLNSVIGLVIITASLLIFNLRTEKKDATISR